MPDIFIRSHAIIDYLTGALLVLLPFAIPYPDQFGRLIAQTPVKLRTLPGALRVFAREYLVAEM